MIAVAASVVLLVVGCGARATQSGPLVFGLDKLDKPETRMCLRRSHLEDGFYLGEIPSNPTDEDITLISLEMVNPKGVTAVGTGAVDNTGNTMSLSGGSEDLKADLQADDLDRPANARVRWPEIHTGNLGYVLKPGQEAQVMIQIRPEQDSGPASVERLRMTYESQGRTYQAVSNGGFYFNAAEVSDCPAD